jgi:hypothetical protein
VDIAFYEVVFVGDTDTMRKFGIAGSIGVVVGMPPHLLQIEDQPPLDGEEGQFAVDVQGTVYAIEAQDLIPTGQVLSRERYVSGEKLEVQPERYEIAEESESDG